MTLEFGLCLFSLFVMAGIGMPVAYAIMLASFVYLAVGGGGIGIGRLRRFGFAAACAGSGKLLSFAQKSAGFEDEGERKRIGCEEGEAIEKRFRAVGEPCNAVLPCHD